MNNALSSWTSYIKELHQWVHKLPKDKPSPFLLKRVQKLGLVLDCQSLPNAVLKRLVYEVQVNFGNPAFLQC
jgi:hypothetical protein